MIRILAAPLREVAAQLKTAASKVIYDGRTTAAGWRNVERCTAYHLPTQAILIYTRDSGLHSSGWCKNPESDRCLHLPMSFAALYRDGPAERLPFDPKLGRRWAKVFFGDHAQLLWDGRVGDAHHYWLFCDQDWQPILPAAMARSARRPAPAHG